ncbi:MAG: heparinase II/III-family protein, partial [Cyclobacteriaceae bacterium]|nr:heparinase II/III-family protein [Cyclobacteriaceae bacterium]
LPDFYHETLEKMYHYLAYTIRPDGYGILNNDADRNFNRKIVLDAARDYRRDDWAYIASNGQTGTPPAQGPSVIFPWAGHVISRSNYSEGAQWSFFDIGPWGSGHQHNDKLHLSVSAWGRDFLVDGGRFAYRGEVADKFRAYAKGSQSHNVVLIDGKGQADGPRLAEKALTDNHFLLTKDFDYAWNSIDTFNDLEGTSGHTRALFYVRGYFWVVVDRISTSQPREIATLWHWHPDRQVTADGNRVLVSEKDQKFFQVIPIGKTKWTIDLVKGQEKPDIQGWYSEQYNTYEPGTASIYSTKIKSDTDFIWILFPSEEKASTVKAKILSRDARAVTLEVEDTGKTWILTVPYSDSAEAAVDFRTP